jgi:hypothetical protein
MKDGEIAKVKVNVADEEYENIIAVVVETSCPEHHRTPCAAPLPQRTSYLPNCRSKVAAAVLRANWKGQLFASSQSQSL